MNSADPLAALRGRSNLAGQVLRLVARLLLEGHLLGSGNAGNVVTSPSGLNKPIDVTCAIAGLQFDK